MRGSSGARTGLLVWLLAALLGACAGPTPRYGGEPFKQIQRQDYLELLDAWTRQSELYHRFETRLLTRATLLSPRFREGFLREYARTYRLPPDQVRPEELTVIGPPGEGPQLYIWTASETPKLASLLERDRIWMLKLYNTEGKFATPLEVVAVKRPTAVESHFFPYVAELGRTWRVRFPAAPEGGRPFLESAAVTLQLAGVQGVAEMRWELAGGAAGPISSSR